MKKSFLFTMVIASACLSACSSDEENIADSNAAVEIKLSSVTNNTISRASIESNNVGVFSAEGISVFALASHKQEDGSKVNWSSTDEYACILNNKLFNAIPNTEKTVTNLVPVGTSYYYPLSDIYTYRFYGAYPSVSAENLSTSATQYKAKYTIDGTQDIIWGQSDDAGYSNKYFKDNPTAVTPNIAFKHLLTRLTFSCEPSGDYAKRLKEDPSVALFVKDVVVNNVPTEGNLIVADNENPANEGKMEFDPETVKDLYLKDINDAAFSPVALKVNGDGTPNKVDVGGAIMLPSNRQFAVTIVLVNKNGEELVTSSKVLSLNASSPFFLPGKTYNVNLQVKSATDIEIKVTSTLDPWVFGEEINVEIDEDGSSTSTPTQGESFDPNGHEYVDLALPSGTKWATCNIGARYPEDNGDYFAWGETEIKTEYNSEGYLGLKNSQEMGTTKDPLHGYSNIAGTQYDVAHMRWGGSWKLPTIDQFNELIAPSNCKIERITMNGKFGYRFTSVRNGNSIFLSHEVGFRTGTIITTANGTYYMSANNYVSSTNALASMLRLRTDVKPQVAISNNSRYYGYPVRPVL